VERKLLESQHAGYEAKLASAKLDLENTIISLSFNGRIAEVNVEVGQYVRVGDVMTIVDGIKTAEVTAQIPISRIRPLIPVGGVTNFQINENLFKQALGFKAKIRLQEIGVEWEARFVRMSDTVDPITRTMGVIVEVDEPYKKVIHGVRPPLIKGMFVEVEIRGKPKADQIVIPRSALHEDKVYLVNNESRLEIRKVDIAIIQAEYVSIVSGLEGGDRVIVSDLIPAIKGMLLSAIQDEEVKKELVSVAIGITE